MVQLDPGGIPTRGPAVLVVTAIMIILSTIFVVFRMISRIAIVRKVSLDDYFMILSWVRKETAKVS
jgi:hypothetical protein